MIVALSAGRDASPELRARIALDDAAMRALLREKHEGVRELVVLSTCHRTELYAAAHGSELDAAHALASLLPALHPTDQAELRFLRGAEAVEHLYRVACGLESLVIGEAQILGQVRRALLVAEQERATGPVLQNVLGRAIRLGRRVRQETSLGDLKMSVGSLTAHHIAEHLDGLDGRRAAIVGAGEAARDAADSLAAAGARISVVSRTAATARRLASAVGGDAFALDDIASVLDDSDAAIVAVSGGLLVGTHHIPARASRPALVIVDVSMPPSVDVVGRDDVLVHTLDDLAVPDAANTHAAVADAEAFVRRGVADFERWAESRVAGHAVGDLHAFAERLVHDEVARASLPDADRERVRALAMRIANKLLHGPTLAMKEADADTQALLRRLFGLDT